MRHAHLLRPSSVWQRITIVDSRCGFVAELSRLSSELIKSPISANLTIASTLFLREQIFVIVLAFLTTLAVPGRVRGAHKDQPTHGTGVVGMSVRTRAALPHGKIAAVKRFD